MKQFKLAVWRIQIAMSDIQGGYSENWRVATVLAPNVQEAINTVILEPGESVSGASLVCAIDADVRPPF